MQNKELGFILKRFLPQKNKICLLSQNYGKIQVITQPVDRCKQIWPGMLISFHKQKKFSKIFIVKNVEIIMNPEYNTSYLNINWIHHMLEICYYFIPLEKPTPKIFDFLYNSFKSIFFIKFFPKHIFHINKIFTLKLFELSGFYPNNNLIEYLNLYDELSCLYIDFTNKYKVNSLRRKLKNITFKEISNIEKWIIKCINTHPNFNSFKTMHKNLKQYKDKI